LAVSNNPSWITITGGTSGSGNGTVTYSVTANTGPTRTGTMTIAGQTFTVNQDAATYTVTASVAGGYGGTVSPLVQIINYGGTASITSSPDPGFGFSSIVDNGVPQSIANPYVISNVVANHNVIVTFAVCAYSPSPINQTFTSCGGTGSFTVNPIGSYPDSCAWTVTNNDPSWVTITSGGSGTGVGPVGYSVASNPANTGVWRNGKIYLTGGAPYDIYQEDCDLGTPNPTVAYFSSSGGADNISITTTGSSCCPWTATTNETWIHITSGSGTSSGTVTYSVDPNPGSSRSGLITIEGLPVIVQQDAGFTLTVTKSGTGTGTVTSSPAGIDCGSDCSEAYSSGTSVTLTAMPDGSSYFVGWSGACSGVGPCTVTMDAAKSANANFSPTSITFDQDFIDRTIWTDLEFVRRINGGVLESALTAYNLWTSNSLVFVNPESVNSFKADLTVKEVNNEGAWLRARLVGNYYSDDSPHLNSFISAQIGIKHTLSGGLVGYYGVVRCFNQECLPGNSETLAWAEGQPGWTVGFNDTKTLSIAWNGDTTFTFNFAGNEVVFNAGTPAPYKGPPEFPWRSIETRVSHPTTSTSGGYISATFDNVYKNGTSEVNKYDDFSDPSGLIDEPRWTRWEFVRQAKNGVFESELTRYDSNGSNNTSFVKSQAILGFEADLKVVEFQNNGARPQARLYAALYNDGSSSGAGDLTGDVTCSVGILEQGSGPQAFYAVSRCTAPSCSLPGDYDVLYSGIFKNVAIDQTHRFSLSWNGLSITLGCDGSAISYNPTFLAPIAGPPKGRKGIGTHVSEISDSTEWAYVSAAFDNVVITAIDSDLDGLDDAWEMANFGTLAYGANDDPDGDGLTNLQEYQYGSNPNADDPDTDGDSIPDAGDNCPFVINSNQWDMDGDSIGDRCDPDADGDSFNSFQHGGCDCNDSDPNVYPGDGTCPAVCGEVAPPSCTDCDLDGVRDSQDNCPGVYNPKVGTVQPDADGDGKGDACDTCPDVFNPDQSIPVWYKDYDNDRYSDGNTIASCNRPRICSSNTSVVCRPVRATDACTETCIGGSWVEVINGGYAYKKATAEGLIATSGDCDDGNPNRYSTNTEVPNNGIDEDCNPNNDYYNPYNIVFDMGKVCSGNINITCSSDSGCPSIGTCVPLYDKWLPKVGVPAEVTARVIGPNSLEVSPVTFTFTFKDVTNYPGQYTNDATPDTNPPGDDFACAPETCRSLNGTPLAGNKLILTPLDFGGRIKISANVQFDIDGGATTVNLTKDLVMPQDIDDDYLADAWELDKFGNLNNGRDTDPDGDGLSNLKEYRGFKWGNLVLNTTNGYCSNDITKTCLNYSHCQGSSCVPYDYRTPAYVPELDSITGSVKEEHFRTHPSRKDLFVKFKDFSPSISDKNYPFAIGAAFNAAGIDVHAVKDTSVASLGDLNIDTVSITNQQSETYGGGNPRTWKRGKRDWPFATLGYSAPPVDTYTYPMVTNIYKVAVDHYVLTDKPYYDGGDGCGVPNGKLDNIDIVQDKKNDNGVNEKFSGKWETDPCNAATCTFTTDSVKYDIDPLTGIYYAPAIPLTCSSVPRGLSSNDIDNNGKVELPLAAFPDTVNTTYEYSIEQVSKHVMTHEIAHALGATHQSTYSSCVMFNQTINFSRDNVFCDVVKGQFNIHNQ
jgi:hypothetical protein